MQRKYAKLARLGNKEDEFSYGLKQSIRDQLLESEGLVSVRTIPPNRRSVTGLLPSRKNGRMVSFESSLERDLATILEFDEAVLAFQEQPVKLRYERAGRRSPPGVPDFLVTYHAYVGRRPLLVDVKYRKELFARWSDLKPRLLAAKRFALREGWDYRILTEVEIRTPYLDNARFLLPYRRCAPDPIHEEQLLSALRRLKFSPIQALLETCCVDEWNRAQLIPTLWCLVGLRNISADLERPLTMSSNVWLPG